MGGTTTTQTDFRYRNDDDDEILASWKATKNTQWVPGVSDLDTPFRVRFQISTTGMDESAGSYIVRLSVNDGAYEAITTSSTNGVISIVSDDVDAPFNGDPTTEQFAGSGTFQAGEMDETGGTGSITILVGNDCEIEYVLQLDSANLSGGEKLEFQVYLDTSPLDAYSNVPTIASAPTPLQGEIQQSHFRIRNIGALQTINQDSDWAGDIDVDATLDYTNIDAGCLFGLRVELEEIASVSANKTIIPKAQYRVNAGSWIDLRDTTDGDIYIDPGSNTAQYAVIVVDKATIADGAVTTNILSGSAKGFVAGTGEHHATAASVSLNNQHTELEWRILIRHRYADSDAVSVQQETTDGDEFEFRVVEDDNTILDGTYVIPKITVNIPAGYIGGTGIETSHNFAFLTMPDGIMYAPIEDGEVNAGIVMLKSIDGGDSWLQQDGTTELDMGDLESWSMIHDPVNDVIHCLHTGGRLNYYQYGTSDNANADQWLDIDDPGTVTFHQLESSIGSTNQSGELVLRGSTLYALYAQLDTTEQIFYQKKATLGQTNDWGVRVSIDTTGGTTDFGGVSAVLGPNSDLIHIFYSDLSNFDIYHVSLSTGDAVGTRHTITNNMADVGSGFMQGLTNCVSWYNGSVEKAIIGFAETANEYLSTRIIENDTTLGGILVASDSTVILNNPTSVNARQPVATLAIDSNTVYAIFSQDSDADIYYTTSADGAAYSSKTSVQTGVTCHAIRAQVFTHSAGNGSAKVFGYIWDTQYNQDSVSPKSGYTGTNRYDEFQISAGAVRRVFITHI